MEQLSFLNDILDKFKSKSSTVALNISSKSVLEVMEFDSKGIIINYASVPIQYNAFTKELENINDFISAVKRTFSELNINIRSRAYISIPTFVIENANFPKIDDDEQIKTLLISSVETNYVFKKYDPAIAFQVLPEDESSSDTMSVTYTALRLDEYSKIIGALQDLGMNIVAVDSSYSTLINGIIATQRVNQNILDKNEPWNIINITSNSFTIFGMKGRHLISIYEEPLAVKSFTEEEVYQVITSSLDLVLDKYVTNQMVIVSQSDEVSAEYLASVINTDVTKAYIEDNKYRKQLVELGYNITQSNKTRITLEAVGTVSWPFNRDGFKFNFIEGKGGAQEVEAVIESVYIPIGNREVELTPELLKKVAFIFAGSIGTVLVLCFIVLFLVGNVLEQQQATVASQISKLEEETKAQPKQAGVGEAEFLQKAYTNNLNFKKSYSALAREIPTMLWIEAAELASDSQLYMAGRSYRMDDILNYYDSLNKLGKFPNLKISVLKISNTPISDLLLNSNSDMTEETTYEFAFGQSFYVDPTIPAAPQATEEQKPEGAPSAPPSNAAPAEQSQDPIPPPPTDLPK